MPDAPITASAWRSTGLSPELPDGTRRRADLPGLALVLVRVEGHWYALEDRCPHRGAELSQGDLQGHLLHCPLHAWPFDVRTGRCPEQPERAVSRHEVRIRDGELQVRVPPLAPAR